MALRPVVGFQVIISEQREASPAGPSESLSNPVYQQTDTSFQKGEPHKLSVGNRAVGSPAYFKLKAGGAFPFPQVTFAIKSDATISH